MDQSILWRTALAACGAICLAGLSCRSESPPTSAAGGGERQPASTGWISLAQEPKDVFFIAATSGCAALRIGDDAEPGETATKGESVTILVPVAPGAIESLIDIAGPLAAWQERSGGSEKGFSVQVRWKVRWTDDDQDGEMTINDLSRGDNKVLTGFLEEANLQTNYHLARAIVYSRRAERLRTRKEFQDAVVAWQNACSVVLKWCTERASRKKMLYDPPVGLELLQAVPGSPAEAERLELLLREGWHLMMKDVLVVESRNEFVLVRFMATPHGLAEGLPAEVSPEWQGRLLKWVRARGGEPKG